MVKDEYNRDKYIVNKDVLNELIPEVVDEDEMNGRTSKTFPWLF